MRLSDWVLFLGLSNGLLELCARPPDPTGDKVLPSLGAWKLYYAYRLLGTCCNFPCECWDHNGLRPFLKSKSAIPSSAIAHARDLRTPSHSLPHTRRHSPNTPSNDTVVC